METCKAHFFSPKTPPVKCCCLGMGGKCFIFPHHIFCHCQVHRSSGLDLHCSRRFFNLQEKMVIFLAQNQREKGWGKFLDYKLKGQIQINTQHWNAQYYKRSVINISNSTTIQPYEALPFLNHCYFYLLPSITPYSYYFTSILTQSRPDPVFNDRNKISQSSKETKKTLSFVVKYYQKWIWHKNMFYSPILEPLSYHMTLTLIPFIHSTLFIKCFFFHSFFFNSSPF